MSWDSSNANPVRDLKAMLDLYPRQLRMNDTHHFGEKLGDLPEEVIEDLNGRFIEGWTPAQVLEAPYVPLAVKNVVTKLPWGWGGERAHRWLYIRPQRIVLGQPDRRSGTFWHVDVDAVYRSVAPDWDDFRAMVASFGDVAETEFMTTPFDITVEGPPQSSDYTRLMSQLEGKPTKFHAPAPGQIAHYTVRDFHRAGAPRKTGWRLVILGFETNAKPQAQWP